MLLQTLMAGSFLYLLLNDLEKGGVTMIPILLMEGATASSAVADVVSTVMATVSSITAHPLVAAAIAVPLTGSVIGLCKRLFSH